MARPKLDRPEFRIRRARSGVWAVYWTEDGATRSVSTGTRDEAEATAYRDVFAAGRLSPAAHQQTVGMILDAYVADRTPEVRSKTLSWAAMPLKAEFGNLMPEHLSPPVVKRYIANRRKLGRSDGTIRRELAGVLRPALAWALGDAAPKIPAPSEPPGRSDWLSRQEWARFLPECKTRHLRLYVLLLLHTAHRSGAVLELTWDRVSLARRIIDFGAGHGNKKRSIVPINDNLFPALEWAHEIRTCDFVVEYASDRVLSCKISFRKAALRAGLDWLTPHVLRHTAPSWMLAEGVDEQEVARFCGMTVEMVRKRYGHHSPSYLRRAAKALEG